MTGHQGYLSAQGDIRGSDVILAGVPFDGTASFRPGARFGPRMIRFWSDVLETYSPSFDMDLEDLEIADAGDLPVPPGDWQAAAPLIQQAVREYLTLGASPLLLGGEHLVTLPAVEAVASFHPDLAVIQLDAHMDLRDEYEGSPLSHATVMRRVLDRVGPGRLLQYGIRSGTRDEWGLAKKLQTVVDRPGEIPSLVGKAPVYLTIDLDVLDPSVMPETGTPEPGGITFTQLHQAILACREVNVVAADVVEYCPSTGSGGPSGAVAAKVVRELIFLLSQSRRLSGS